MHLHAEEAHELLEIEPPWGMGDEMKRGMEVTGLECS